jgi:3-hydroxyisobutyrate dehydrogenase-like beta-hydroxyacid dehydrogenase
MTRGVAGAKQGTLAFFIGGEQADIDRAKPVLQAMGDTFIQFRSAADAHAAKVISNVLSYATVALVNEALMLGAESGVDLKTLHEALTQGAPSKALEAFGPRLIAGDYDPPRVTVEHVCADMILAQEMASSGLAPVFLLGAAQKVYRLIQSRGHAGRDLSIIAELWRAATPGGKA